MKMEDIVNYAKSYGFIYQGSEIYNGLSNSWDYGPLGTNLKENLRNAWKKKFIQEQRFNFGLDSAIITNPKVWVASGHVASFADPLIDCKKCKSRHRADKLVEEFTKGELNGDGWDNDKLYNYIVENNIVCPKCGKLDYTTIRKFNLLFETSIGVTEETKNTVYLRGETAQGIFINFKNIERSMRAKIPFGVCQTGKAFRNEITPGNFIFRTREFEQMELEFFCKPGTDLEWHEYWKNYCFNFLISLGLKKENLKLRDHTADELSFYSKATTDIEYMYPNGWGELWGIADRTDYDLGVHQTHSGVDLRVIDTETNEKYLPYVIEPSVGLDRLLLAILTDSLKYETLENGDTREVLKIMPYLAPIKLTVLPLVKKIHGEKAIELFNEMSKYFPVTYDETGSIGKRYRRCDAVGTPFVVTVDDEIENGIVTLRHRDTMEQIKINVEDIKNYVLNKINF